MQTAIKLGNLNKLLTALCVVICIHCSTNKNGTQEKVVFKPNSEVEVYIKEWKEDKLGCKKLRTKEKAEIIVDSLKLNSSSQKEFEKIFDVPNRRREYDGNIIFEYYFDAVCNDGKFVDSADYCVAAFTFLKDKLIDRSYICQ